jgi:hypothetical protein
MFPGTLPPADNGFCDTSWAAAGPAANNISVLATPRQMARMQADGVRVVFVWSVMEKSSKEFGARYNGRLTVDCRTTIARPPSVAGLLLRAVTRK